MIKRKLIVLRPILVLGTLIKNGIVVVKITPQKLRTNVSAMTNVSTVKTAALTT
jgi:hypothetical protein